jgi:hypothetical protein
MATFDLGTRCCFTDGVSADTDSKGTKVITSCCCSGSSSIVRESGISDDLVACIVSSGGCGSCGSGFVGDIGDSGLSKDSDESDDVSGGIFVGCAKDSGCAKESGCETSIGDSERTDPIE